MKINRKTEILFLSFIVLSYLLSRFFQLTSIPVFGDEAIYLRWSQIIHSVDTLRFVPLSDGKQPLFMWLTVIFLKVFADPLFAGRTLAVVAGLVNLITIYIFSSIFLSPKTAKISAILYTVLPFTFFFDRLSLPDNLLSALGSLSLLFSLLLAHSPRLDLAMILGAFLGAAWLTKAPAVYFLGLAFLTFVLHRRQNYRQIYLPLISVAIAIGIYNILRLGPQFSQLAIRNRDYIWPFTEIIKHPLDPLVPHLRDLLVIFSQYLTWPVILISVVGFFISRQPRPKTTLLIITCWAVFPLLTNLAIAKVFTGRYILYSIPPLIILLAAGISHFKFNRLLTYLLGTLLIMPCLVFNWQLSTRPFSVKLYDTEAGYTKTWTAGWGIKPAAEFLIDRSLHANIIVGTEGYFGTLPDGLQIYTNQINQLTVFGVGLDINRIPSKLVDARNHGDEVYLLFNSSRLKLTPTDYTQLTLVRTYPKPDGDQLVLLKLK